MGIRERKDGLGSLGDYGCAGDARINFTATFEAERIWPAVTAFSYANGLAELAGKIAIKVTGSDVHPASGGRSPEG